MISRTNIGFQRTNDFKTTSRLQICGPVAETMIEAPKRIGGALLMKARSIVVNAALVFGLLFHLSCRSSVTDGQWQGWLKHDNFQVPALIEFTVEEQGRYVSNLSVAGQSVPGKFLIANREFMATGEPSVWGKFDGSDTASGGVGRGVRLSGNNSTSVFDMELKWTAHRVRESVQK